MIPDAREAFEHKLQDWPDWARRGLIDAFCPMAYTASLPVFNRQVAAARAGRGAAPGVGRHRRLSADAGADHRSHRRRPQAGAAGVVLFSYDSLVESTARDPLGDIGRVAFAPSRAAAGPAASARPPRPATR